MPIKLRADPSQQLRLHFGLAMAKVVWMLLGYFLAPETGLDLGPSVVSNVVAVMVGHLAVQAQAFQRSLDFQQGPVQLHGFVHAALVALLLCSVTILLGQRYLCTLQLRCSDQCSSKLVSMAPPLRHHPVHWIPHQLPIWNH